MRSIPLRRHAPWVLAAGAATLATLAGAPVASGSSPKVLELAVGKGGLPIESGGAGNEQPTVTTLEKNGKRYVVTIFMSSDVDFFEGPWQCKCTSVAIGATGEPEVVANQVQLTHLFGDRPCNHPKAATDGEHVVWTFGSDDFFEPTVQTYAGVVDETCQQVSAPIRISANYNNNEGAPDIVYNGGGRFTAGYLSTGGQDISYARGLTKIGGSLQKGFLDAVVTPANIGRPAILPLSASRSLFCAAKGDQRPPEVGVSCAMMDLETGQELWEQTLAASDPYNEVFMNQPSLALLDGGRVALQVIESDGLGKNKNKKGSSRTHLYVLSPDDAGPNVTTKKDSIGPYQAHSTICSGAYGMDGAMKIGVFDASITGSGLATMTFAGFDGSQIQVDKLKDEWVVGAHDGDSGYIANKYGNNPGTQGREFLRCIGDVPNPGAGVAGGFMPEAKTFFAVPYTGRKPGEGKNALFLSLVPGHTTEPVAPEPPIEATTAAATTGATTGAGGTTGGDGGGGAPPAAAGGDPGDYGYDPPAGTAVTSYCAVVAPGSPGSPAALALFAVALLGLARRREEV